MISQNEENDIEALLVVNASKKMTVKDLLDEYKNLISQFYPQAKGVNSFYEYIEKMPDIVKILNPELGDCSPVEHIVPNKLKRIRDLALRCKVGKHQLIEELIPLNDNIFPSTEFVRCAIEKIKDPHINGTKITDFSNYMACVLRVKRWSLMYSMDDLYDLVRVKNGRVFLNHMRENSIDENENSENGDNEEAVNALEVISSNYVELVMSVDKYLEYMLDPTATFEFDTRYKMPPDLISIDPLEKVIDNIRCLLRAAPDGLPIDCFRKLYEKNYGKLYMHLYGWQNVYDMLAHLPSVFRYDSSTDDQLRLFDVINGVNQFNVPRYIKLNILLLLRGYCRIEIERLFHKYKKMFGHKLNLSEYGIANKFQFVWVLSDFMKLALYEDNTCFVSLKCVNVLNRLWMYHCDAIEQVEQKLNFPESDVKLRLLPLPNVNDEIEVYLHAVYSVEYFYMIPNVYCDQLSALLHEIQLYYKQRNGEIQMDSSLISPGTLCAYKGVNFSEYRRCRVLRIIDEHRVELFGIDTGVRFTTDKRRILRLPVEFFNLPELAIRGKLYGIDDLNYSRIFTDRFFIQSKIISAVIVEVDAEKRILTCELKRREMYPTEDILDVLKQHRQNIVVVDNKELYSDDRPINPCTDQILPDDHSLVKCDVLHASQNKDGKKTDDDGKFHVSTRPTASQCLSNDVPLQIVQHSSSNYLQNPVKNETIPTDRYNQVNEISSRSSLPTQCKSTSASAHSQSHVKFSSYMSPRLSKPNECKFVSPVYRPLLEHRTKLLNTRDTGLKPRHVSHIFGHTYGS